MGFDEGEAPALVKALTGRDAMMASFEELDKNLGLLDGGFRDPKGRDELQNIWNRVMVLASMRKMDQVRGMIHELGHLFEDLVGKDRRFITPKRKTYTLQEDR